MRFFISIILGINLYYSALCCNFKIDYTPISEQTFQEEYNFLKEMTILLPTTSKRSAKKSITAETRKEPIAKSSAKKCACQMKKHNSADMKAENDYFAPLDLEKEIASNDTKSKLAPTSSAPNASKSCGCNNKINITQLQEQNNTIERTLTRVEIHRKKRLRQNLSLALKHYKKQ